MSPADALYAALVAPLGLVLRAGDGDALRRARSELARSDDALRELAILGPDASAQVWLVRKDRLRELLAKEKETGNVS